MRAPHHQGHAAHGEFIQLIVMVPLADQHDAHRPAGQIGLTSAVEVFGIDARQQHVVAALRAGIGQAANQGKEKWVRQALAGMRVKGHDHGDRVALLEPQVLRADID